MSEKAEVAVVGIDIGKNSLDRAAPMGSELCPHGAGLVIEKPFRNAQMIESVDRLIRGYRPVAGVVAPQSSQVLRRPRDD